MTNEKVLFAFRAEENEDGYTFIVNHDKEAFPFRCPFIAGHSYPSFKADMVKQLRKFRRFSKRRMRRRLKIYERMYRDLYGTQKEDQE
jgi:hypothetical protein